MQIENIVLADFPCLAVDEAEVSEQTVWLHPHLNQTFASCPKCACPSQRVHSNYVRQLTDLPLVGKSLQLILRVRRFFCDNPACAKRTFAEQPTDLATFRARRTLRQHNLLLNLAFALGGKPGAAEAARMGVKVSLVSLLRLIRNTPQPPQPTPRILGVDDWAKHKGVEYGTILVDLERHCPIELLPDREASTLAAWLASHPGVEILSRDRASAYSQAASQAAPDAIQVADRFHLIKNLTDHLKDLFARKAACLLPAVTPPTVTINPVAVANKLELTSSEAEKVSVEAKAVVEMAVTNLAQTGYETESELAMSVPPPIVTPDTANIAEEKPDYNSLLYTEIKRLYKEAGFSQREIARYLQISRQTVSKYLKAERVPRYIRRAKVVSKLDLYKPYLEQRWQEGEYKIHKLYSEIKARGYRGGCSLVARFLAELRIRKPPAVTQREKRGRKTKAATKAKLVKPQPLLSAKEAALLMTTEPEKLKEKQVAQLQHLLQFDEEVVAAYTLSQEFAVMLRERRGFELESWLGRVETKVAQAQVRELGSFAKGIRQDQAAVTMGLTLEVSQGQVEGKVNRLKTLKRAMYGRASFETLKARVLHRSSV